jgi:flagellin
MDVLGSAGQLELSLSRTQLDEERQVRALASGLRVVSAVDDPSGLAISENIHTKVLGLQQGVQNVQTATNLITVADSALSIVQEILERVHGLIVEAHSDINSTSDLNQIQDEIDTLLQEINKLAGNAKFNGISLFDGHLSAYDPYPVFAQIVQVNAEGNADGTIPNPDVSNATGALGGAPGPLITQSGIGQATSVPELMEFRVISYDKATDSDVVQLTAYSVSGPTAFGQAPEMQDIAYIPVNGGPFSGISTPTPSGGGVMLQNYTIANLTPQDVGSAIAFLVYNPGFNAIAPPSGSPLEINSGGDEGQIVGVALPAIDANTLGLSGMNVLPHAIVDANNNVTGYTNSNTYSADYAELQVQGAMDAINHVRAQLGAQSTSLQEDAGDASLEIVNQVASESAIRDVDMGQAVAQFTRDQILSQVGISVLAQMQQNAQLVIQLVGAVNPGVEGLI